MPGWPRTFRVPVAAMRPCVVDAVIVAALAGGNREETSAWSRSRGDRAAGRGARRPLVAGAVHAFANLAFLGIALRGFDGGGRDARERPGSSGALRRRLRRLSAGFGFGFGFRVGSYGEVVAGSHLRACLGVVTTALSSRRPPSVHVLVAVLASVTSVTSLAAKGAFAVDAARLDAAQIFFVATYSCVVAMAQFGARAVTSRVLARAGWLPPTGGASPDRSDDAVVGGGATWRVRRSRELTRAETSRVAAFADSVYQPLEEHAESDPSRRRRGVGNDAYARGGGGSFRTSGKEEEFSSPPRGERLVNRGRMLRESVRRDLSDRSAGGWEPDVPPGTASDAGSGGGMPVPDYESEDGRMRPWAGLDDDDAAADAHSDFDEISAAASDDVDDPAAVAAANAGRSCPAPTSARAIAAANAAAPSARPRPVNRGAR